MLTNNNSDSGAINTDFGRIDTVTGTYTSIASLTGDVWNLAWNPVAQNFFTTPDSDTLTSSTLRTITTTGNLSSSLGTIGKKIYGMAYRTSDSLLYAYDYNADDTGTINTANGAWSVLNSNSGTGTAGPVGGRYSIMNDTIYFAVNGAIDAFGTIGYTPTSTFQQIATNAAFARMIIANDGTTMYGVFGNGTSGQQQLYTINTTTGVLTPGMMITGTNLGTFFHGASIVPVPEPSTYALATIATATFGYIARRRKAARA